MDIPQLLFCVISVYWQFPLQDIHQHLYSLISSSANLYFHSLLPSFSLPCLYCLSPPSAQPDVVSELPKHRPLLCERAHCQHISRINVEVLVRCNLNTQLSRQVSHKCLNRVGACACWLKASPTLFHLYRSKVKGHNQGHARSKSCILTPTTIFKWLCRGPHCVHCSFCKKQRNKNHSQSQISGPALHF